MKKPFSIIAIGIWVVAIFVFGFLAFKIFIDRKLSAIKAVDLVLDLRSQPDESKLNALFTDDYTKAPKRKGSLINTITYNLEYQKSADSDIVTMFYGTDKESKSLPVLKFSLVNMGNFFKYNWKVGDIEEADPYLSETVANILIEKKTQEISNKSFDIDGFAASLISIEEKKAEDNSETEEDDYFLVKFKYNDSQQVKDKKIIAILQDKDGDCTSRTPLGLSEPKGGVSEERLYLYRDCKVENIFMYGLINDNIKLNVE